MKNIILLTIVSLLLLPNCKDHKQDEPGISGAGYIRPYERNPRYWQYKNKPLLLIGGGDHDNLFQSDNLQEELNALKNSGGNFVRNTMSTRDSGNLQPFAKDDNGFDLDQWNPDYWNCLDSFLYHTQQKSIVVQLEIWAQWDFYDKNWDNNPWNPENNINYNTINTKLGQQYHDVLKKKTIHPFFHTIPALSNDSILLKYQKKFVNKILTKTLKYNHILYCITNEIFTQYPPEWGFYWADHIKEQATDTAKIQVTEMYHSKNMFHDHYRQGFDHPQYGYLELSGNNLNNGTQHWDNLQYVYNYIADRPRPINNVKVYGNDQSGWTTGTNEGIDRFWRNITGGSAGIRFYRPNVGLGLSPIAQKQIKNANKLIEFTPIYNCRPDSRHALLKDRDNNEAYMTYDAGNLFVIYFPDTGEVKLDLGAFKGKYNMKWLNIESSTWIKGSTIRGGGLINVKTPGKGKFIVVITKK